MKRAPWQDVQGRSPHADRRRRESAAIAGHEIYVSEHAYWRAAERFPRFDTVRIEPEVRQAFAAGRISTSRAHLGIHDRSDPTNLYVWTEDGRRVYALRHDEEPPKWIVTTVLRAGRRTT